MCENKNKLLKISNKLNKCKSYDEWEYYNDIAEDLCYKIATCKTKCNSDYCRDLQETSPL